MNPIAEALLYAAARAQHVATIVRPALTAGKVIVCDRFLDSSLAYQGYARGMGVGLIEQINAPAVDGLHPDLTLIFDYDSDSGLTRIFKSGRETDRIEQAGQAFHRKVREGFLALAKGSSYRKVIDANRSVEAINEDVLRIVMELLK
jgi:dTMP kinase